MRVLFATQPGHGHLNPMVPYASTLRKAGHDVRFATAPLACIRGVLNQAPEQFGEDI